MGTDDILAKLRGKGGASNQQGEHTEQESAGEKRTPVEGFKSESEYLRGSIPDELVDGSDKFGKSSVQLLKHHGTYQQDNRDGRAAGAGGKSEKSYSFMVRSAIPGGKLTSNQLLAHLDLGDDVGNGTIRITTRQGIQLHGVVKADLKETIQRINDTQLTTLAACGDVRRNVMCSPCPYKGDPVYDQMQELADLLAWELRPHTKAYHQIWLTDSETGETTLAGGSRNGEKADGDDGVEPLYGPTYLPRKFKIAIALPGDNSADIYSDDVGLLAICEDWKIVGYNVLVGGGFGVTPSASKTFAAVAKPMCYVDRDEVLEVVKAIIKVQRDFGNRSDRKVARMKYLIHQWGLDRFKSKVEEYANRELAPPKDVHVEAFNDGMGWHAQGDGKFFYGLNVENGRVKDEGRYQLKTALRKIGAELAPPIRLTAHQSIIFCDLAEGDRSRIDQILREHGVPLLEDTSTARRYAMACPALPTCGLAITESERALPGLIDELEQELASMGLADEVFTTRMTGCPNGCARPYNSDIGLVGKAKGKYTVFLGGRVLGDRLNWIYRDMVPAEEVVPSLGRVFREFKAGREPGETFGDFCERLGKDELLLRCESA